jgi:hypothetical protein
MKYRKCVLSVSVVALICFLSLGAIQITSALSDFSLELKTDKDTYILGEPVTTKFILTNTSKADLSVGCFGVSTGELQLFISKDGDKFLEYNSNWGVVDAYCKNKIKSGDRIKTSDVKVLWNIKPSVEHLNKESAKEVQKGKLLLDYAFRDEGTYYLKVIYNGKLESEPVKITITEPEGKDLEVWNKIKDNGNFAYFIQEGDMLIPTYKPEERAKFQAEVEDILQKYPNSFYAQSLRQSLDKFKVSEVKRQEFIEKMKSQQKQKP